MTIKAPILYDAAEMEFADMGIGVLSDAISCIVTEERNGLYELSMTYPMGGVHCAELSVDRIILAPPNDTAQWQPFRIYSVRPSMAGTVAVDAEHISYQLNHIVVAPFMVGGGVQNTLQQFKLHMSTPCPFNFWTDKTGGVTYSQILPASARSRLMGEEGSVLDIFGGEYEWDRFTVKLHDSRGADNGVVVAYGKNLTDLQQEINISSMLTGIYPYYYQGNEVVTLPEMVVTVDYNCSYSRIKAVDLTSEFNEKPSEDDLRGQAIRYINANKLTVPRVSMQVAFAPLWETEEYKDIAPLEHVGLCDTVTVRFPAQGVDAKSKVIRTEYDVLLGRYQSIELGDARQSLDNTIAGLIEGRTMK